MPEIINTYAGGINRDLAKSKTGNTTYHSAKNVRVITDSSATTGVLENVNGNRMKYILPNGLTCVGNCVLRDEVVLFCTDTNGSSYICKVDFSFTESIITATILYDDTTAIGSLGFSINNPILEAVGAYENSQVRKIYFADGVNQLRVVNLATLRLPTDPDGIYPTDVSLFDIVPNVDFDFPILQDIGNGGNLKVGVVQYAYQFYINNGQETKFSPASNFIHLTKSSEDDLDSRDYLGSDIGEDTGKYVRLVIENIDDKYNKIRVISLHYSDIESEPIITVIREEDLQENQTEYSFIDDGSIELDKLTTNEYITLGGEIIIPYTIDIKDNYLVPANIKSIDFDVDFDARSYRYMNNGGGIVESRVYQKDGTEYYIDVNGNWTNMSTLESGSAFELPDNIDAINKYNDLNNDKESSSTSPVYLNVLSNTPYVFQSDGITVGGEGVNIKYRFKSRLMYFDNNAKAESCFTNKLSEINSFNGKDYINESYSAFESPYNSGLLRKFQCDEVYRFGIVFIDSRGRQSFVKWIGDIRMPRIGQYIEGQKKYMVYNDDSPDATNIKGDIVYPEFTISNIPLDASSGLPYKYRIVHVKRESKDRTILGQGLVSQVMNNGQSYIPNALQPVTSNEDNAFTELKNNPQRNAYVFNFISPEISFQSDSYKFKQGDFIQVIGTIGFRKITGFPSFLQKCVYLYDGDITTRVERRKFELDELFYVQGSSDVLVRGYDYDYNHFNQTQAGDFRRGGYPGSCLVGKVSYGGAYNLKQAIPLWLENFKPASSNGVVYANLKRNLSSQYGGNGYSDRANNVYIKASDVISPNVQTSICDCLYGDTYMTLFEFQKTMAVLSYYYQDLGEDNVTYTDTVIFPCESQINTKLRSGKPYTQSSGNRYLIQEYAGTHASSVEPTYTFTQEKPLYSYNTVYSRKDDIVIYFPKPLNFKDISERDCMIRISEKKINGEELDSWTIFKTDNFIEADSRYGKITKVINYNNNIVCFQDRAIGTPSINQRSLIADESGGQLELGTGELLSRYDYIDTESGCSYRKGIAKGNGLYFYDTYDNKLKVLSGKQRSVAINEIKGLTGFFINNIYRELPIVDNPLLNKGIVSYYDSEHSEVLFTFDIKTNGVTSNVVTGGGISDITCKFENNEFELSLGQSVRLYYADIYEDVYVLSILNETITFRGTTSLIPINANVFFLQRKTLAFNEIMRAFSTFYSFAPTQYFSIGNMMYSMNNNETSYVHNFGLKGTFYGVTYESSMYFMINPNGRLISQFNNIEFGSNVISNGIDLYNETLTSYRIKTDYQDTNMVNFANNTNIVRHLRKWRFDIARNWDYTNSIQTRERIRDYYILLQLNYNNISNNQLILNDIVTKFAKSNY